MCEHEDFIANVNVHRLTSEDKLKVVGFNADIKVKCAGCGQAFEFIGIEAGVSPFEPRVSIDSTQLRAPIKPSTGQLVFESSNSKLN